MLPYVSKKYVNFLFMGGQKYHSVLNYYINIFSVSISIILLLFSFCKEYKSSNSLQIKLMNCDFYKCLFFFFLDEDFIYVSVSNDVQKL